MGNCFRCFSNVSIGRNSPALWHRAALQVAAVLPRNGKAFWGANSWVLPIILYISGDILYIYNTIITRIYIYIYMYINILRYNPFTKWDAPPSRQSWKLMKIWRFIVRVTTFIFNLRFFFSNIFWFVAQTQYLGSGDSSHTSCSRVEFLA